MLFVENVEIPFDFGSILIYLSGIATGFILACLIYVLLMLLSINKSKKIIEASVNNITEEDKQSNVKARMEKGKNYLPAPMHRGLMFKSSQEIILVMSVLAFIPQIVPHSPVFSSSPQIFTFSGDKFAVQQNLIRTATR